MMPSFKLSMDSLPIDSAHVLFDISRLLRSHDRRFATGVDRIDLEIGLDLAHRFGMNCRFLFADGGRIAVLDHGMGRAALTALNAVWNGIGDAGEARTTLKRLFRNARLRALFGSGRRQRLDGNTTYVVASHSGLGRIAGGMKRLDPGRLMKRTVYIHDIIPLEMPEYQRPQTRAAFRRYLNELTDAPLTLVSNSCDTDARVRALAAREGWSVDRFLVAIPRLMAQPDKQKAPLRPDLAAYLGDERPIFTVIGTIEPRKNHLLLLNLWRQIVSEHPAPPRLCIIGKRGWENENIIDMLERCDAIKPVVTEFGDLTDDEVQELMTASRALLFPSFTEGLGIPLLEAAALSLPCIVSDIPVFREIAPPGTVFLDPLDGPGWKAAILSRIRQQLQA